MIRSLVVALVVLFVATIALGVFLSPDDLKSCDATPSEAERCHRADAIVAVSGGNTPVRVAEAIALYQAGWGDYLIVSGAAQDPDAPSNAAVMRQQALKAGVPESAIITEGESRTTKQNAERVNELLQSRNIASVIVVTSPYHQRRAGIEFQHMAGSEVEVRRHPAKNDPDWPLAWWLTPRGWWLAGSELTKVIVAYMGESS